MTNRVKPLKIFKSPFSDEYYASRAYKDLGEGRFEITGQKENITEHINAIIEQHLDMLKERGWVNNTPAQATKELTEWLIENIAGSRSFTSSELVAKKLQEFIEAQTAPLLARIDELEKPEKELTIP